MEKKQKITDLNYLKEVTGGEASVMRELIEMFFEQIPEFTKGMRTYLEEQRWRELGELAHKAKSSVMTFGMNDLGKKLKELQLSTVNSDNPAIFSSYVDEFEAVINEAEKELKAELLELK